MTATEEELLSVPEAAIALGLNLDKLRTNLKREDIASLFRRAGHIRVIDRTRLPELQAALEE